MSYTGDVTVGGPADSRELPGLTITKVAVGPMNNNAYLLRCTSTGELLLIDAANEAATLLGLLGGAVPERIVTTHRHQDHWVALGEVQQATGAPTVAHHDDAPAIGVPHHRAGQPRRRDQRRATPGCPSSTCAATPPAASRCATTAPGPWRTRRTCSPATRCSPAGPATPRATRPGSAR